MLRAHWCWKHLHHPRVLSRIERGKFKVSQPGWRVCNCLFPSRDINAETYDREYWCRQRPWQRRPRLVVRPPLGVAACMIDSSRDMPRFPFDEKRARNVFVDYVCRGRREDLYEVTDPRLKRRLSKPSDQPIDYRNIYPDSAKRERHEGRAPMAFVVEANGSVDSISVIASSGYQDLDDAAALFLTRAHFDVPARLDGINVPVIMYQRFEFKLALH
jgi:TonB family protein